MNKLLFNISNLHVYVNSTKTAKTNLSYKVKKDSNYKIVRILPITNFYGNGAPERTRTSGTQFRKLLLYPAELRAPKNVT